MICEVSRAVNYFRVDVFEALNILMILNFLIGFFKDLKRINIINIQAINCAKS